MRRTFFVTLATALFASSALIGTASHAADAGTYRPGNAYHSITAASPDVCEMQCSGDAQCRSWNYIRISANTDGVCEFNDNISSPVPSAMSISGDTVSRARAARVVAGKTNTVRIGSPSVTQNFAPQTPPRAMAKSVQSTNTHTRPHRPNVYRPSAPRQIVDPSLMHQQRLAAQRRSQVAAIAPHSRQTPGQSQPLQRSQFRHNLDDNRSAPSAPHQYRSKAGAQSSPTAQTYAFADPRLQKKVQARRQSPQGKPSRPPVQTYPPAAAQSAPQTFAAASGGLSAPPGVPPIETGLTGSYMSPSMAGAPTSQAPRRVTIPAELSPRPMGSGESLFGSLYDDVKVPRQIDPRLAADPGAPISTVKSVPSSQFTQSPL